MQEARERLQRHGIASSASMPARSLAAVVIEHWSQQASTLNKTLADWLLDMERIRYAPTTSGAPTDLKPLRERWRALQRQNWPQKQNTKP